MKIILVMAITADGKIAKHKNHFPDWTSREDRAFFAEFSRKQKVVLMGGNTFKTFKNPLKDRLNVVFTNKKDTELYDNVLYVSGKPEDVVKKLEQQGHNSAVLGGGAHLNTQFLISGLIDEIFLTVEPIVFGQGISLFKDEFEVNLELIKTEKLNKNTVLLRYKVIK
ncbi:MAG: dihydrofolate reductase family protein [Patescibacteria group bacterium]|nr:dihydrofolate reductase family protein [Patescibacteria group bacterium]